MSIEDDPLEDDWYPVQGFPGYSINPLGHVKHDSNGRILRVRYNQYNVAYVGLMREDRQCSRSLPLLVATTFLDPPNENFNTPIQLDGDSTNCHMSNIMWRPHHYAVKYKRQFEQQYEFAIHESLYAIPEPNEDGSLPEVEVFSNSMAAACRYGLLEIEVVLSIIKRTPAWPTYQFFELVEMV